MSRALGKDIAALLEAGEAGAAYQAISEALRLSPKDDLLEIEILPKSHPLEPGTHLLRDGSAIAVSKLGLVQASLVARKTLKTHPDKATPQPEETLADATAVILLMDPEHLTAANVRKRLLQTHLSDPDELRKRAEREKRLIDSLLTSRLHRHTKSPTLWNHRRWLLELSIRLAIPMDVPRDMTNVVMVSGERHPRNYYSWLHARFMVTLPSTGPSEVNKTVLPAVKDWCFRHHTDTSGWSFLYFLFNLRGSASETTISSVFMETVHLATSLRWANESVWVFLRTTAASGLVGETEYAALVSARDSLLEKVRDPAQTRVLEASLAWCDSHRAMPRDLRWAEINKQLTLTPNLHPPAAPSQVSAGQSVANL